MNKLKQGMAAVALVASLGLVMPASFGGPASADISSKRGNQPMTIACDLDGDDDNGYEYESKVNSRDHEFTNNNTVGAERFKFSTLQDLNSNLVFVPQSGDVTSIYTAVKDEGGDTETTEDDTWGDAAVPVDPEELDGVYPASFEIPPGHPYSYFLGGFSLGKSDEKLKLVDCDVTDVGKANPGEFCYADGEKLVQEADGPAVCFQNVYPAGDFEIDTDNVPYCLVDGEPQDKCFRFVPDDPLTEDVDETVTVFYHYTDIFHIKAEVTGNPVAIQAAMADDASAQDADQPQRSNSKHKNGGGKHRHQGKHRK